MAIARGRSPRSQLRDVMCSQELAKMRAFDPNYQHNARASKPRPWSPAASFATIGRVAAVAAAAVVRGTELQDAEAGGPDIYKIDLFGAAHTESAASVEDRGISSCTGAQPHTESLPTCLKHDSPFRLGRSSSHGKMSPAKTLLAARSPNVFASPASRRSSPQLRSASRDDCGLSRSPSAGSQSFQARSPQPCGSSHGQKSCPYSIKAQEFVQTNLVANVESRSNELAAHYGTDGSTGGSTGEGGIECMGGDTGNAFAAALCSTRKVSGISTFSAMHRSASQARKGSAGSDQTALKNLMSNPKALERLRNVGLSPTWLADTIRKNPKAYRVNTLGGDDGSPEFQTLLETALTEGLTGGVGRKSASTAPTAKPPMPTMPKSSWAPAIGKGSGEGASKVTGKGVGKGIGSSSATDKGKPSSSKGTGKGKAPGKGGKGKAPGKGGKGKAPGKGGQVGEKGSGKAPASPPPRKPDLMPGVPVKKLFWSSFRVAGDDDKSIWAAMEGDGFEVDYAELEGLFAIASGNAQSIRGVPEPKAPKVNKVQILGSQRRRQLLVMLSRLPAIPDLCEAVTKIDVAKLAKEQVELLLLSMPPDDEIKTMHKAAEYKVIDESNVWDTPEQFVLALSEVAHFKLRLEVWDFESSFLEQFAKISKAQRAMLAGCHCMLESQAIRHLFGLVLSAGNYLNGGTSRGRADGFAIDTLAQVRTVKMSQTNSAKGPGSGTLVDYLAQQMEIKYVGELDTMFGEGDDAEKIHCAARGRIDDLGEELKELMAILSGMLRNVSRDGLMSYADSVFAQHREILCMCQCELEELHRQQVRLAAAYADVCSWFRMEDASCKKSSAEFFGIVDTFMREMLKAHEGRQTELKALQRRERSQTRSVMRRHTIQGTDQQDSTPDGSPDCVERTPRAKSRERSASLGPGRRRMSSFSTLPLASEPPQTAEQGASFCMDQCEGARLDIASTSDYVSKLVASCSQVADARARSQSREITGSRVGAGLEPSSGHAVDSL